MKRSQIDKIEEMTPVERERELRFHFEKLLWSVDRVFQDMQNTPEKIEIPEWFKINLDVVKEHKDIVQKLLKIRESEPKFQGNNVLKFP